MIIIAGTAEFENEGLRDGAVAATAPLVKATRDDEPGCLAYVFSADSVDPTMMVIYELWEDAATLDAHFQHENYFRMRDILRSGFGKLKAHHMKYRIDARDPVYGEDRVASSRFWSAE